MANDWQRGLPYSFTAHAQRVVLVNPAGEVASALGPVPGGAATATVFNMVGGEYRTTLPTRTDGQQGPMQTDEKGNVRVRLMGYNVAGADGVSNASLTSISSWNEVTSPGARPLSVAISGYNGVGNTWDRIRADANGQAASPHAIASARWNFAGVAGGIVNTTDVAVMSAGGASVRNYMTGLQFCNTSATASEIVVKDGSTVIWRGMAPASMAMPHNVTFDVPLRGTANTALNVAMLTTATATRVSAQGFQGV